jgi:nicotinate phosphoribosyltransferase
VRVDTSESLIDRSVLEEIQAADGVTRDDEVRGVTPRLVFLLRRALDDAGYGHVRIVASGGFDAAKIKRFEELAVPVDVYGVGSALVSGTGFDHTADIVRLDGKPLAKTGREYVSSDRLHSVDWHSLVAEADWARSS